MDRQGIGIGMRHRERERWTGEQARIESMNRGIQVIQKRGESVDAIKHRHSDRRCSFWRAGCGPDLVRQMYMRQMSNVDRLNVFGTT